MDEKILVLSKDDIEIEEKVISKDFVESYIKLFILLEDNIKRYVEIISEN